MCHHHDGTAFQLLAEVRDRYDAITRLQSRQHGIAIDSEQSTATQKNQHQGAKTRLRKALVLISWQ
jgi:hypothetical protein